MNDRTPQPVWHRIHPLTIFVELARVLKRFLIFIVIFVVSMVTRSGSGDSMTELFGAAVGAIVVIPAVIRYFTFGYSIHGGKLLVKSGLITKNVRTIPLDRIQNINLSRDIVHRILGLVDLDIETASSAKAEASISALNEEQAKVLKAQLMREVPKLTSPFQEELRKKVIYKPSTWELFLAGASENKLAAIFATLVTLNIFGQGAMESLITRYGRNIKATAASIHSSWIWIALAILVMLMIGWIYSIISTFVRYYGFELTDEGGGKVKRAYGMFNHVENVLPLKRVQTVVFQQNLIQKFLKIGKIVVSTAGGFGQKKDAEGHRQEVALPVLTPVLHQDAFPRLRSLVLPQLQGDGEAERNKVAKGTILRHIRSSIVTGIVLAAGSAFFIKWNALWIVLAAVGLGALSGYLYYRYTFYQDVDDVIVAGTGWFTRRQFYLPTAKVQAVTVRQSPIQRAFKMASVELSTASPLFQKTEVEDLPVELASDLARSVHYRSSCGRDTLLDGF